MGGNRVASPSPPPDPLTIGGDGWKGEGGGAIPGVVRDYFYGFYCVCLYVRLFKDFIMNFNFTEKSTF